MTTRATASAQLQEGLYVYVVALPTPQTRYPVATFEGIQVFIASCHTHSHTHARARFYHREYQRVSHQETKSFSAAETQHISLSSSNSMDLTAFDRLEKAEKQNAGASVQHSALFLHFALSFFLLLESLAVKRNLLSPTQENFVAAVLLQK